MKKFPFATKQRTTEPETSRGTSSETVTPVRKQARPETKTTDVQTPVQQTSGSASPTGSVTQRQVKRGKIAVFTEKSQRNLPLSQRKYLKSRPLPSMAATVMKGPSIDANARLTLTATLKEKDIKTKDNSDVENVVRVQINGTDYVIKPHTRDGEINVVNTNILRTLGIPNLTASACRLLKPDEVQTIAEKLPETSLSGMSNRGLYEPEYGMAYVDQISDYAAGTTQIGELNPLAQTRRDKETRILEDCKDATNIKVAIAKYALVDPDVKVKSYTTLGDDPEIAYEALIDAGDVISPQYKTTYLKNKQTYDQARQAGQLTKEEWEQAQKDLNSNDATKSNQAADRINKVVGLAGGKSGDPGNQYKAAVMLAGQGRDAVSSGILDLESQTNHYNALLEELSTPGSNVQKALVALATVDLIVGMSDHLFVAGEVNNFGFDGNNIVCIDNAKTFNPTQRRDLTGGTPASINWRDFYSSDFNDPNTMGNYIAKQLNAKLKGPLPHNNPAPQISKEVISAVVADTLERLALVSGDPALDPGISQQLKYRLQYITASKPSSSATNIT